MKLNRIIFVFLFLGLLFQAKAQTALFNVLASKGNVKYVSQGTDIEKNMVIGKKLFPSDKIVVGENAYLGLAHSGGKTIEIKRAGTYEVSKLASEVANQNASVSKKYIDFLAGEINNNGQDMAKNKYKYMGVTGSVERGGHPITIYSPKDVLVLNAPLTVKWDPNDIAIETYTVSLLNIFDEPLYTTETTSNSITIDLTKYDLPKQKHMFLLVQSKDNKNIDTEKVKLESLGAKDAEIAKQADALKAELSENTALNKFVLARFYTDKGLIINAVEQYEAAIALEPEVEDYKAAYGELLVKTDIKKAAKEE